MNVNNGKTRTLVSVILLIWAFVCIAVTCMNTESRVDAASTTGTLNIDYVYFRKSPAGTKITYKGKAILLRKGQKMTILSTSNKKWYKVKLTYKKKTYKGYVYASYITIKKSTATKTGHIIKGQNYVYFRKTAGGTPITYNKKAIMLMSGQKMTILSTSNKKWYKVKLTYKNKTYTGYVYSAFIKIDKTTAASTTTTAAETTTQSATEAESTAKSGYINDNYIYFRKTAGGTPLTYSGKAIMLMKNQKLTILSTSNKKWYKVKLTYKKKSYTGYVYSSYIAVDSSTDSSTEDSTGSTTSDAAFEAHLTKQGFPESYKVLLRKLHKEHPNWVFKAVHTGLSWSEVVANEVNTTSRVINLVNGTSLTPCYSWRSTTVGYNYKTDTYTSYDGSTWFAASDALVKYYLDPRNYLTNDEDVFAFEKLSYDSSQTRSGVEAILYGSFMYKSKPQGSSLTYSALIIKAAQKSGVSPYHIASRIKQEVGNTATSGTNGKNTKYPGIYNFYNIGAFESSSGNAITNGLKWAASGTTYNRPWTSAEKSIIGGAMYIGEDYISKGQNTLYTQKFNVTYTDSLYGHQYMGNVQAPMTEAAKVYTAYKSSGALKKAITFAIPVYEDMPSTAVSKPSSSSGSSNAYLKSLTVGKYQLTPVFDINSTTTYTVNVDSTVTGVTITASAVNSYATITGTGSVSLKKGKNTFKVVCKAQDKTKRTYTIIINRG